MLPHVFHHLINLELIQSTALNYLSSNTEQPCPNEMRSRSSGETKPPLAGINPRTVRVAPS